MVGWWVGGGGWLVGVMTADDGVQAIVGDIAPGQGVTPDEKHRRERDAIEGMCDLLRPYSAAAADACLERCVTRTSRAHHGRITRASPARQSHVSLLNSDVMSVMCSSCVMYVSCMRHGGHVQATRQSYRSNYTSMRCWFVVGCVQSYMPITRQTRQTRGMHACAGCQPYVMLASTVRHARASVTRCDQPPARTGAARSRVVVVVSNGLIPHPT